MNTHQNWTGRFTRRSCLDDGYYVRMPDDRLTAKRFAGGLLFVAAFLGAYIVLASVV